MYVPLFMRHSVCVNKVVLNFYTRNFLARQIYVFASVHIIRSLYVEMKLRILYSPALIVPFRRQEHKKFSSMSFAAASTMRAELVAYGFKLLRLLKGTCCVCCCEEIEPRPRGVFASSFRSFVPVADHTK